jgi:hypothetical protein
MNDNYKEFEATLDQKNLEILKSLKNPVQVQTYLDNIPYISEDLNRTPLMVMKDRQCHCLDGGLFAALALNRIGFPARIIDLIPEPGIDDDHVLAIFQVEGCYGAIAKSNFAGLRYREPVYRSLRELVMSYFEVFFNANGRKTMRGYTRPLNLSAYDRFNWQSKQEGTNRVIDRFYSMKMVPVLSNDQFSRLLPVDDRSFQAGMLGTDPKGLFKIGDDHS